MARGIAIILSIAVLVMISADYEIVPDVVAAGGQAATSADYAMTSTAGQPAIGLATSADYALCHGYWCADLALPGIIIPGTNARLIYSFTFGQLAIATVALALLVAIGSRWMYDVIMARIA